MKRRIVAAVVCAILGAAAFAGLAALHQHQAEGVTYCADGPDYGYCESKYIGDVTARAVLTADAVGAGLGALVGYAAFRRRTPRAHRPEFLRSWSPPSTTLSGPRTPGRGSARHYW